MIERGVNGRVSGFYIVRNLIEERLITAADKFIEAEGRRILTDAAFSSEIRFDAVVRENLSELAEEFARLYYYVEEDERLRAPSYLLSEKVAAAVGNRDMTGMAFLNLFSMGEAKMFRHGERYSVAVNSDFLHGIPDGPNKFRQLGERVLSFSGDCSPVYTEEFGAQHVTEKLNDSLTVTYPLTAEGEEIPVYLRDEAELTEKELIIRKNYRENMEKLAELIGASGENKEVKTEAAPEERRTAEIAELLSEKETDKETAAYSLTFEKAHRIHGDAFTVNVPDGFMWRLDSDRKAFGIYGPLRGEAVTGCPLSLQGAASEERIPVNGGDEVLRTVHTGRLTLAVIAKCGSIRPDEETIDKILDCVKQS